MKKIEKRLRRDSVKVERYVCGECLPANCVCSKQTYSQVFNAKVDQSENLSYRRS